MKKPLKDWQIFIIIAIIMVIVTLIIEAGRSVEPKVNESIEDMSAGIHEVKVRLNSNIIEFFERKEPVNISATVINSYSVVRYGSSFERIAVELPDGEILTLGISIPIYKEGDIVTLEQYETLFGSIRYRVIQNVY